MKKDDLISRKAVVLNLVPDPPPPDPPPPDPPPPDPTDPEETRG